MKDGIRQVDGYDELNVLEQRTIRYIHRTFGHSPFTLERFLQEAPPASPQAEWHVGLLGLCRDRAVQVMRKTWGERLYQIPIRDYFEQFGESYPQLQDLAEHLPLDAAVTSSESVAGMTEQVLLLLLEVDREPVRLTQKGQLHKKSKERLAAKLGLAEESTGQEDDRCLRQLNEPLDMALRMELIEKKKDELAISEQRFAAWLGQNPHAREERMFMIWYRVHCPEHPALQWLTAAARRLPDERWMALDMLLDIMEHHSLRADRRDIDGWLDRLLTAGWIELGTDEGGVRWIRRKCVADEQAKSLIIQQDFEIIALPNTSFRVIRKLGQISEPLSSDTVHRFRLTMNGVRQAFERGWDAKAIVDYLQEHALDELPDHLRITIHQWESGRGMIRAISGVLLVADNERAVLALSMNKEQLQLQRLNERYWFAEGGKADDVMKRLDQLGLAPVISGPSDEKNVYDTDDEEALTDVWLQPASEDLALRPDAPGLYMPRDASVLYRPEKVEPSHSEVYPDYERIPAIWYRQYRRYHPSTARQLIEQAIRWRTGVRMRAADEEHDFVPHSIEEADGSWTISGYCGLEPMRLPLHRIEQLKLLMPGFKTD